MARAEAPLRIVSLVPSATETVFALDLGDALVGRSHACNFPPAALEAPALTTAQLGSSTSRGIHDEVRMRLGEGLTLFDLDLDRLRALKPTHLLIQDQCSVCAVSPGDLGDALRVGFETPPALVSLAPHQLIDVWRDFHAVGTALSVPDRSAALRESLSVRLSELTESIGIIHERPRVACLEWLEPMMIAGHWVPELVQLAGGDAVLAQTGDASRTVDLETLAAARPDVLVVQICGFDLETSRTHLLEDPQRLGALRKLRDRHGGTVPVALIDGDAYFNRPGPRLVDSAEVLGEVLYPEKAATAHGAAAWEWIVPPGGVTSLGAKAPAFRA